MGELHECGLVGQKIWEREDFINIEQINLKYKNDNEKIYRMQQSISNKVFKKLDIFGQNVQLNFNGENQYQTAVGGLFSIAIIAVIALFFQQNIVNFLNRNEINLNTQTIFDSNPDSVLLNDDNYMFALAIEQTKFNTIPYFNITLKQRIYTRFPNGTLHKNDTFIDLIPCTQDRFQNIFNNQDFSSQFISLNLQEWLCPQYNYSIQLSGGYTSDIFEFVKITVSECSNDTTSNSFLTWKPECANTQSRDRFLQSERSFRIKMYMTNNVLNPLQVQNISQVFLDDESFFSFLLSTGTETDVFYQKYNVTTHDNIFPYPKQSVQSVYNVKKAGDYKTSTVQNNPQQYAAIYMRRSPYTYVIKRDFEDIADLLSYLGGFANIVALIFGIMIKSYNKSRFMIELANQIYDFPIKNDNPADTQQRKQIKKTIARAKSRTIIIKHQEQEQVLSSPLQSPKFTQHQQLLINDTIKQEQQHTSKQDEIYQAKSEQYITNQQEEQRLFQQEQEQIIQQLGINDRKSYLTQQIQKILNRSKPILFNYKYILSKIFCAKFFYDRNSILLQKAIKKINKDLDLCVIIDKVKEINLLKELLLTHDQLILFDFAPKQAINLQEEEQKMTRSLVKRTLDNMRTNSNSVDSIQQNESITAYYKLFQAYDHIHQSLQQNNKINEKLIEKLGQEVRDIFEVSHFIQFDKNQIKSQKDDDIQFDSVNSDPLSINNIEQIRVNLKIKI